MKIIVISFLAAFALAPLVGPGALIFALLGLATVCFTGATVVGRIERRMDAVPEPGVDDPTLSSEVDEYLTALEKNEDCWIPARCGKEKPFPYEGKLYLRVINHYVDDIGYLDLRTGEIRTNAGSGEKIAQVDPSDYR